MITYGEVKGARETKIPGLGWVLARPTEYGIKDMKMGFKIVGLKATGEGFKTRDEARGAKAELGKAKAKA